MSLQNLLNADAILHAAFYERDFAKWIILTSKTPSWIKLHCGVAMAKSCILEPLLCQSILIYNLKITGWCRPVNTMIPLSNEK